MENYQEFCIHHSPSYSAARAPQQAMDAKKDCLSVRLPGTTIHKGGRRCDSFAGSSVKIVVYVKKIVSSSFCGVKTYFEAMETESMTAG